MQDIAKQGRETTTVFGRWSETYVLLGLATLWFAIAILFNLQPGIDRAVSTYFFTTTTCADGSGRVSCGVFASGLNVFLWTIRQVLQIIPVVVLVGLVAIIIRDVRRRNRPIPGRATYAATAVAAYILGPGLLVNGLLKAHWGRPRPVNTDLFGGDLPFVPAGQWSDACHSNCSFISGEAASAFWLVCLVPLLPAAWRRPGLFAILAVATFAAGLRVAFGAHYLSDVVLGGLSTLVLFSGLACLAARFIGPRRAA